ncbi:endonuclease III-like protein 1 [Anastrepha obliqua]|uniref:endonuclease III-like protein 1 n=1 Tax=Anastrepha obliqua TaxID=95512 RepID=UPI002409964F|nr:endonuclease III-like protein 1 [Anastrepha obliqua]
MGEKGAVLKTLAKKLSEKTRIGRVVEVQDIEDTIKAPFFSPVQTRQQRKLNQTQILEFPTKPQTTGPTAESSGLKKETAKPGTSPKNIDVAATTTTKKVKKDFESTMKWEPKDWRLMLDNIRIMRTVDAPVDTMGCHKCSDDKADEKTQRFQKLVALMLSSQTKDEITFDAMQRLKSNQMTPRIIAAMERSKLEELLKPVSFYKNKAKYLQLTSQVLIDKYDSDIPGTIKELEALPGVGPKMAHLCMSTAWNEVTGIGVDVHVHRITNRLKWLPKPTKEPEQTRIALESWLPRDMWPEVNHLLVGFGQTVCKAVRPRCMACLNSGICPAAQCKNVVKSLKTGPKILLMDNDDSKDVTVTKRSKLQNPKKVSIENGR